MEFMRLDKVISNCGIGTRKETKELVKKGLVKVNNIIVKDSGMHVNPEKDIIEISNERLAYRKYIYVMLNKPDGVITATEDKFNKTVLDLIDDSYKCFNLFPVGRLDKDTEGLILLTNNGELSHKILSPKNHIPKKYFVKILGEILKKDIEYFEQGVILEDGYKTMPAKINVLSSGTYSEVELIIFEGKFHQVKRMFKALDKEVVYLKRISMGGLVLDSKLELGQYKELTEKEIEMIFK